MLELGGRHRRRSAPTIRHSVRGAPKERIACAVLDQLAHALYGDGCRSIGILIGHRLYEDPDGRTSRPQLGSAHHSVLRRFKFVWRTTPANLRTATVRQLQSTLYNVAQYYASKRHTVT